MFQLSDEIGNSFFVEDYQLALRIASENSNPFINVVKLDDRVKVDEEDVVTDYDDFLLLWC